MNNQTEITAKDLEHKTEERQQVFAAIETLQEFLDGTLDFSSDDEMVSAFATLARKMRKFDF